MVIGVVNEDVEHHAAKQLPHLRHVELLLGHATPPQQLGELGIAYTV